MYQMWDVIRILCLQIREGGLYIFSLYSHSLQTQCVKLTCFWSIMLADFLMKFHFFFRDPLNSSGQFGVKPYMCLQQCEKRRSTLCKIRLFCTQERSISIVESGKTDSACFPSARFELSNPCAVCAAKCNNRNWNATRTKL